MIGFCRRVSRTSPEPYSSARSASSIASAGRQPTDWDAEAHVPPSVALLVDAGVVLLPVLGGPTGVVRVLVADVLAGGPQIGVDVLLVVEQVADPLGAVIVDEEARAVLRADLPVAVVVVQFDEPADDVVRLVRGHEHVQRAGDAGLSPAEPAADAHVEAERLPAVDLFFSRVRVRCR